MILYYSSVILVCVLYILWNILQDVKTQKIYHLGVLALIFTSLNAGEYVTAACAGILIGLVLFNKQEEINKTPTIRQIRIALGFFVLTCYSVMLYKAIT